MDTRTALYTGGCQCGLIRYSVFAPPSEPVTLCHCRMCQKALGSSFGIFLAIKLTDFQWTRGSVTSFQSSSLARRLFCTQCGTPLAYLAKERPFIDICLGSFDQPQLFGKPQLQMGTESCLGEWALVPDVDRKTTDEIIKDTVISYQHPDADTTELEWQQISKNKSTERKSE